MAKRGGQGREGRERTLTKDLSGSHSVAESREDNWCSHASQHKDLCYNASAQHPSTLCACVLL